MAPDAVFEVRSRSQSPEELRGKAAWYLENGVRLVVLLDHRVEVFRPGGMEAYQGPERVPLDPELPGFALETRGLFLP
ncbi:Uma2 family endonuclease [Thermus sp.]|uniref:Uma2 family endonuclease n=1 Tax=Thermus sp. TaxID=275 RepID=UPI003D0FE0B6